MVIITNWYTEHGLVSLHRMNIIVFLESVLFIGKP